MKKDTRNTFILLDAAILTVLLLIGLMVRMYKVNTPLADFHSWRQADTAAVARNFARDGFNLLSPRYDDLSNFQSGVENPEGYRFVEFPIYNAIFAASYTIAPFVPIEVHGRMVSAIFSLCIVAILYYFLLKETGRIGAVFAAATYATLPTVIFWSRVVLPDVMAVSTSFISAFFLYKWVEEKNKKGWIYLFLSLFFFTTSVLVKPTVIFFAIPLIYLFVRRYDLSVVKNPVVYLFFILSVIPLALWRFYIQAHPEGIPASAWLITTVNTFEGPRTIFLRPAFFRWIFFERINNIALGGYLTFLFLLGVVSQTKKYFLYSILAASLLYLFVFEGGNVQHEYYQILIYPALAIFIGVGVNFLYAKKRELTSVALSTAVVISCFALAYYFSYYKVKEYYHIPNDLIQISSIIKTFTSPNDKIVTDRMGDTTLLYLSDRKGSPGMSKSPEEFKTMGYKYLVTASKDLIQDMQVKQTGKIVFQNDQFTLFEL